MFKNLKAKRQIVGLTTENNREKGRPGETAYLMKELLQLLLLLSQEIDLPFHRFNPQAIHSATRESTD